MISILYPRLGAQDTLTQISNIVSSTPEIIALGNPEPKLGVGETYAEIGGTRAKNTDLELLQSGLREIAKQFGFPSPLSRDAAHHFDNSVGIFLFENMRISAHEASQPSVWQFISAMLVPDLVRWRFPGDPITGTSIERFVGGRRNTFGRLWWRAFILGNKSASNEDPYELMKALGEDELVQLMERPAVFGDRRLVKAVAEAFVTESKNSSVTRQKLMREIQKRLMRKMPLVFFGGMDDVALDKEMRQLAHQTSQIIINSNSDSK